MPIDTSVKFIHSGMAGAPSLTNTAGSMISLLEACLVNGFALQTVDSIVIAAGVATVTRGAGHPFNVDGIDAVALIAGATVTGGSVNGERKVLASPAPSATQYSFDATGIPDQVATGAITHRVAPLGWVKAFTGTNLAAFKSADPAATGCLLRVDDTGTTDARVVAYEAMTDINTGTGAFPTPAQVSGGRFWQKRNGSGNSPWVMFGDGRFFYLAAAWHATYPTQYGVFAAFGDYPATKSPDPYACLLYGAGSSYASTNPGLAGSELAISDTSGETNGPRAYTGLGSSLALNRRAVSPWAVSGVSGNSAMAARYPNEPDGGLYVAPMVLHDVPSYVLRGALPGIWFIPQATNATFGARDRVVGVTGLVGKALRAVALGVGGTQNGAIFFDTTGPWR